MCPMAWTLEDPERSRSAVDLAGLEGEEVVYDFFEQGEVALKRRKIAPGSQ